MNYVVSRRKVGGQKLPILLGKKTTKRREGITNCLIGDDIVYGRPQSVNILAGIT